MMPTPIEELPVVKLALNCHKPPRDEALKRLVAIHGRRWAVLDFETASKDHPLVIEVGLVDADGAVLLECMVQPGIPITPFVHAIHKITDDDVADAEPWPEVQARMARVLREHGIEVVLAYNAAFEGMCLAYNAKAWGIDPLEVELECLQEIACGLTGYKEGTEWLSLRTACQRLGVERLSGHRAVADCKATVPLVAAMTLDLFIANISFE